MNWLFDTDGFVARSVCGVGWNSALVWSANLSDILILVCYLVIPLASVRIYRRVFIQHGALRSPALGLLLSCAFIVTCGLTHLSDALMYHWPAYHLDIAIRVLCAACSVATISWMWSNLRGS